MCFDTKLTIAFDHVIVESPSPDSVNNLSYWSWNILYKTLTVWRKPFNGEDMKHPINGKVRSYYVCNSIEFKKVSVSLRKLKHLSSWQCHDLSSCARLWPLNRQKRFVLVYPSIASHLGRNFWSYDKLLIDWIWLGADGKIFGSRSCSKAFAVLLPLN